MRDECLRARQDSVEIIVTFFDLKAVKLKK